MLSSSKCCSASVPVESTDQIQPTNCVHLSASFIKHAGRLPDRRQVLSVESISLKVFSHVYTTSTTFRFGGCARRTHSRRTEDKSAEACLPATNGVERLESSMRLQYEQSWKQNTYTPSLKTQAPHRGCGETYPADALWSAVSIHPLKRNICRTWSARSETAMPTVPGIQSLTHEACRFRCTRIYMRKFVLH